MDSFAFPVFETNELTKLLPKTAPAIATVLQKSEECGLESAVMPLVFCPFQNRVFCLAFVVLNQSRYW